MPCIPVPAMPEPFAEFPWAKDVHTWDVYRGHFEDAWVFRIWYPSPAPDWSLSVAEFFDAAWSRHSEVWRWFETNARLVQIPQFEASGRAFGDTIQKYDRLAAFGVFAVTTPN